MQSTENPTPARRRPTPHQRYTLDVYARRIEALGRPVPVTDCHGAVSRLVDKGYLVDAEPRIGPRGGRTRMVRLP